MTDPQGSSIQATRVPEISCGKCGNAIHVADLPMFAAFECPHCQTRLTVPALLGQFLLLEELGTGGMGAVYRAVDQSLGRFVAIKVMKSALGDDPSLLQSFLREARTAAALNHPNIVQIYASGQEHGQPFIVMELVSGGRLDQMMAGGKTVPEARLLQIALHVSEGLKAANEAGLVHGDIKPANILFDKKGVAKIADFGLAQFIHRQQERGEVWGTPFYISPESARGQRPDHRADIYSLGATLYHALAGRPPFDGKTPSDVVMARLQGPAPDIAQHNPDLHPKTAAIINRMLQPELMQRYPNTASLQADLREALEDLAPRGPSTVGRPVARASAGAARSSRRGLWITLVVVLVLLLAGATAFFLTRRGKATEGKARTRVASPVAAEGAARPKIPIFADILGSEVGRALQEIDQKSPETARKALQGFHKNRTSVPVGSAQDYWMTLVEFIPDLVRIGKGSWDGELDKIARLSPSNDTALAMAQMLAAYTLGKASDADFEKAAAAWPVWYTDFASFYSGLRLLADDNLVKGQARLRAYAGSKQVEPEWVYVLKGRAAEWANTAEQLQKSRELATAGKADEAETAKRKALKGAPAFLTNLFVDFGKPSAPK